MLLLNETNELETNATINELETNATALVVLNDDDTFTDLRDCKIVWTNPEVDLDETHPMDCKLGTVSIEFLLEFYLDYMEVNQSLSNIKFLAEYYVDGKELQQ
jgi:hypothetical protein